MVQTISITLFFGVTIGNKFGDRLTCLVGTLLVAIFSFLSSFTTNFGVFVTLYGILFGIFSGCVYMIPYNTAYKYFPGNKGIASGCISAGLGLGSFIFSWIAFAIVNPNNVDPEKING